MAKRIAFMVFMVAACVVLFLQRLTGMGVHAILGLVVLGASIWHTVKYRKTWKTRSPAQKFWEIFMWTGLAVAIISGFLLKPFTGVGVVVMAHKLGAVAFALGLFMHIRVHLRRFRTGKIKK